MAVYYGGFPVSVKSALPRLSRILVKKRQLEKAKPVIELDRNLIVIAVLIIALPIIAALAAMLTVLAVSEH